MIRARSMKFQRGSLYQRVFLLNATILVVATLIVAITTTGFPEGCHAIGVYTRLDTQAALSFLAQYVVL